MWACARGHQDTANILYKWNHNALNVRDHKSRTPIDMANDAGFTDLAMELERMETKRKETDPPQLFSSSILNMKSMQNSSQHQSTTEHCSDFNEFNTSMYGIPSATTQLISNATDNDRLIHSDKNAIEDSVAELIAASRVSEYLDNASPKSVESQNSNRSHDGVFLRPGAVGTR